MKPLIKLITIETAIIQQYIQIRVCEIASDW